MDFRQRLFQYRSYTPIPFLLLMIIVAHPTMLSFFAGLCVVCSGEFIRLWGVSIAGSETRTTGAVGGTFLITTGPFAHVRNPLYLGNILMYFGIGIMSDAPILALVALVYFIFQYSLIVALEEEYLIKRFGSEFVQYCESVKRFLPSFVAYTGGTHEQPGIDWKRGLRSERRTLQAIALLIVVLLVLWYVRG